MNTRLLSIALMASVAHNAQAADFGRWFEGSRYSFGIAAGNERYRIGVPDGSDRKDNAYLNESMDNLVGFIVRKARHHTRDDLHLSHRIRRENSETVYKLGLNQDRIMVKTQYRF